MYTRGIQYPDCLSPWSDFFNLYRRYSPSWQLPIWVFHLYVFIKDSIQALTSIWWTCLHIILDRIRWEYKVIVDSIVLCKSLCHKTTLKLFNLSLVQCPMFVFEYLVASNTLASFRELNEIIQGYFLYLHEWWRWNSILHARSTSSASPPFHFNQHRFNGEVYNAQKTNNLDLESYDTKYSHSRYSSQNAES